MCIFMQLPNASVLRLFLAGMVEDRCSFLAWLAPASCQIQVPGELQIIPNG